MIKYHQPAFKLSKKIEIVKKVVLPEVLKPNDSVMNENLKHQTVFSKKKTLKND